MQNLVADEECELEFEPLLLIAQPLVDEHRARRLETRAHQGALAAVAVEPADLEAVALADVHQILEREGHLAFSALFGGPLDVGEIVVASLLPDPNQQLSELPARRAGLRQKFRQRA